MAARWSPDAWGRGLSFALSPRWGAARGGAEAPWGEELPRVAASGSEASVDAQLGYGIGAGPGALLRPFVETDLASGSGSRVLRLGARYEARGGLALEVAGERRESPATKAGHALKLDLNVPF